MVNDGGLGVQVKLTRMASPTIRKPREYPNKSTTWSLMGCSPGVQGTDSQLGGQGLHRAIQFSEETNLSLKVDWLYQYNFTIIVGYSFVTVVEVRIGI